MPKGWKGRLIKIKNENTGGGTGFCLDPIDLVVSKLAAGREKDFVFVQSFLKQKMGTVEEIKERVCLLPDDNRPRKTNQVILSWLDAHGWEEDVEKKAKPSL